MSRRFPRAGSIESLVGRRIFLVARDGPGGKTNATKADEGFGKRWALEDPIGPLLEAHGAPCGGLIGAVTGLGIDRERPRGTQTVATDAGAMVPLNHRPVERPWRLAEVTEDILHSDMVRIGAFASHTTSIVADLLR